MKNLIYIIISWIILSIIYVLELDNKAEMIISIILIINYIIIWKYNQLDIKLEYILLFLINLLGIISIIWSKDLISMYVGLEGYSYSLYYLLVMRLNPRRKRIGLIYIILNSLSSLSILYNIYIVFSTSNIFSIPLLSKVHMITERIGGEWLTIGILFKLGIFPFIEIYKTIYKEVKKGILYYVLFIPKVINIYIIYKLHKVIQLDGKILIFVGIITILYVGYKGLKTNLVNELLIYSSLLTTGYFIISLGFKIKNDLINIESNYWLPLFLYSFQLAILFILLFLWNRRSILDSFLIPSKFSFYFLLINIFSFIGIPPLSGFYLKVYLLYPIISEDDYILESRLLCLILFFLGNILSTLIYFKLIIPSSTLIDNPSSSSSSSIISNKDLEWALYLMIICSWLIITYPLYYELLYIWFK